MQNLPDSFDWGEKGRPISSDFVACNAGVLPGVVAPVRNQKALGSCWAVSAAEAVEGHGFSQRQSGAQRFLVQDSWQRQPES